MRILCNIFVCYCYKAAVYVLAYTVEKRARHIAEIVLYPPQKFFPSKNVFSKDFFHYLIHSMASHSASSRLWRVDQQKNIFCIM